MTEVEASPVVTQSDSITHFDTRNLQIGCWIALIVIAIVRAWFTRYEFDGDALSYLDIARAIAEGHAGAAINAFWSPGYPVVLSVFLWMFRPNVYWECPLVHFVNVLIFIAALASFQLLWGEVRLLHENYAEDHGAKIPERAFWILGYSIFAMATLNIITVALVHPDLLVAAFCCLAGWAGLSFRRTPSAGRALLLGFVLALGFYAKAPFLPMGLILILCACFAQPVSRRTFIHAGAALIALFLVCGPFVAAISLANNRFTVGDSARLAYAFYIDGVQHFQHWQGGPPGVGTPIHPTRKLNDIPEVYEFAAKDMGTYPPWFDPTYWYEGITPRLNWTHHAKFFLANLILEFQIIVDTGAELLCAMIILALLARRWSRRVLHFWFIWAPGVAALVMFALVHVESRFLGGWLILLFAGAICACSLPADRSILFAVSCVGIATLGTVGAAQVTQATEEALRSDHAGGRSPRNALIATFLLHNGLRQGDQVAVIGDGMYVYWAHLARLHVVAEIPANTKLYEAHPALDFWESGSEQQKHSLRILEQTGAEAVIAFTQGLVEGSVPSITPAPWKKIDGTDAYVYFFRANP